MNSIPEQYRERDIMYRKWIISFNPKPIPDFRHDYDVWHEDYDGPEDDRCFTCGGVDEAKNLIDDYYAEMEDHKAANRG